MRFNTTVCLCVAGAILINATGSLCQSDVCGQSSKTLRIVGGNNATDGSWPWHVVLYKSQYGSYFCGGTLISKRWVLTAAHCLKGININNMVIYLGRLNQEDPNPNEINRGVSRVIQHPQYKCSTKDNDIALLQLSSTVYYTDYIKPVCLAGANSSFAANTNSWVTGWGKLTADSSIFPNKLQEATVVIVNDSVCREFCYKQMTENMICAGLVKEECMQQRSNCLPDACEGDSGGPLVNKKGSQWIQFGIVSFGRGCGEPCSPGVYTKVSKYESWIKSSTICDQPGFIDFISSANISSANISSANISSANISSANISSASSFRDKFNSFLFSLSLTFSIIPLQIFF